MRAMSQPPPPLLQYAASDTSPCRRSPALRPFARLARQHRLSGGSSSQQHFCSAFWPRCLSAHCSSHSASTRVSETPSATRRSCSSGCGSQRSQISASPRRMGSIHCCVCKGAKNGGRHIVVLQASRFDHLRTCGNRRRLRHTVIPLLFTRRYCAGSTGSHGRV